MKKARLFLLAFLLLLSMTGLATAQLVYNPATGMSYETIPVYNNSGGTLDAGDVVVWDIASSTGDNDAYVTTTTTADTDLVAGVIWPSSIAAASSGTMAILGLVECDLGAQGVASGGPLCTSGTAGGGDMCTSANLSATYAIANTVGATGSQVSCVLVH